MSFHRHSSPISCTLSTGWVNVHYTTIYRSSTWFDLSTCTEDKSTISLSQLQIYIACHSTATATPCLAPLSQDGLKCTIPLAPFSHGHRDPGLIRIDPATFTRAVAFLWLITSQPGRNINKKLISYVHLILDRRRFVSFGQRWTCTFS